MKNRYTLLDKENRQLIIGDNLKLTYWMLKFVLLTNVFQMLMRIYSASISKLDTQTLLCISIGLASLFSLFIFSRLSTAEVIPLEDIQNAVSKFFFGRKRLSLKLTNGKTRHLPAKTLSEFRKSRIS